MLQPDIASFDAAISRIHDLDERTSGEDPFVIRSEMKLVMQNNFGVFRDQTTMQRGLDQLNQLRERLKHVVLKDKSKVFNTSRIGIFELENLMMAACATAYSAINRQESRGAHSREDYKERDDQNWLKHLIYSKSNQITYRKVNMSPHEVDTFEPKARVY